MGVAENQALVTGTMGGKTPKGQKENIPNLVKR